MTPVTRATGIRCGAPELQAAYQRYWLTAFGIAVSCHLLVLVWYSLGGGGVRIIPDPAPHRPDGPIIDALSPLPRGNTVLPNVRTLPPARGWDRQIPIPVRASDGPLDNPPEGIWKGEGESGGDSPDGAGGSVGRSRDGSGSPQQTVPFEAVEHPPMVVIAAEPGYPRAALSSGLTGHVVVRILVNVEGKPAKVEIESSDNDLFNESALEAARKFVFAPGAMTSGPVAVWVSLPFTFRLEGGAR